MRAIRQSRGLSPNRVMGEWHAAESGGREEGSQGVGGCFFRGGDEELEVEMEMERNCARQFFYC